MSTPDNRSRSRLATFKKLLAVLVTGGICVHVGIILWLTFYPDKTKNPSSLIMRGYQHFIHIGPFFREDAIKSSKHVVVGYLKEGIWHHVDLTDTLVEQYFRSPWQVQKLTVRDRIGVHAEGLIRKKQWQRSRDFARLYEYFTMRHPEVQEGDSVSIALVVHWYKPELKRHVPDTLFYQTFIPVDE